MMRAIRGRALTGRVGTGTNQANMNGFNGGGGARAVGKGFLGQITHDAGARGTAGRRITHSAPPPKRTNMATLTRKGILSFRYTISG
jgi:hypothetical protein